MGKRRVAGDRNKSTQHSNGAVDESDAGTPGRLHWQDRGPGILGDLVRAMSARDGEAANVPRQVSGLEGRCRTDISERGRTEGCSRQTPGSEGMAEDT